jgi:biopolymer transport protein ExbD
MSRRTVRWNEGRAFEEPTVNLTPLIDVVFVILITFIVIAPLLELDHVELAEAGIGVENKVQSVQEASPIAIYVREDNAILINGKFVTLAQLATYLKQAKQTHPHAQPQLFQDKKAHFGTYQSVKNAAEAAGFKQLDIILKPA